jgi:hypothetical protein
MPLPTNFGISGAVAGEEIRFCDQLLLMSRRGRENSQQEGRLLI